MSFFKRLAIFILILVGMILFWAIFPVVAQSATSVPEKNSETLSRPAA